MEARGRTGGGSQPGGRNGFIESVTQAEPSKIIVSVRWSGGKPRKRKQVSKSMKMLSISSIQRISSQEGKAVALDKQLVPECKSVKSLS